MVNQQSYSVANKSYTLESEVRKYVFKPLTAQVKPSVKPSPKKREKKEKLLNDKTGYFYFGKVE